MRYHMRSVFLPSLVLLHRMRYHMLMAFLPFLVLPNHMHYRMDLTNSLRMRLRNLRFLIFSSEINLVKQLFS